MKIEQIKYNWFYSNENGEECNVYRVSTNDDIISIKEHTAQGEGDKFYYDVVFKDEHIERIFNINSVIYVKDEVEKFCDNFIKS